MGFSREPIDLFSDGQPGNFTRQYWKQRLANPDVVDRISKNINSASVSGIKEARQDDYFFEGASVKTVLKPRNLHDESKEFFQANLDLTKDFLPKETLAQSGTTVDSDRVRVDLYDQEWHRNADFASEKMAVDPNSAFMIEFPTGRGIPTSQAQSPTSILSGEHKGGFRYDGGVVNSLQLEEKAGATQIGDHYLPDNAWSGQEKITPPPFQLSAWDGNKGFTDLNFQPGLGAKKPLNNLGDLLQKHLEEKALKAKKSV